MDALGGYMAFACVFLAAGIAAEHVKQIPFSIMNNLNFIIVGAIAGISNLTMRLIYQHFCSIGGQKTEKASILYQDELHIVLRFRQMVDKNLGITGLLMPAVLVGAVLQQLHWVVLCYAVYYVLAFIVVTARLVINAERSQHAL